MAAWREVQVERGSECPAGRGGAGCVAIDGRRILFYGGADRTPTAFGDFWLLELGDGMPHWTRLSPVVKLSNKRKLLPRSGATLTFIPAAGEGGKGGRVYIFGGQEPVGGVILDELLSLDTSSWELTDVRLTSAPAASQQQPADQQQQQQKAPDQQQQQQQAAGKPQRPPARHSHVAGVYERESGGAGLIVYGGAGLRGPLGDVWVWSPDEDDAAGSGGGAAGSWQCLSQDLDEDECPARREMAAGCMISDEGLLVHGGRGADGAVLDDLSIFDGRAGRWVVQQQTRYPLCAHTACMAAGGTSGGAAGADAGGGGAAGGASNVLLFGGFTGEAVAGDLLQLTFLRQQRSSGAHSLRAELRPVKAEGAAPAPRFAHGAAVLPDGMAIVGGVNEAEDLIDAHVWGQKGSEAAAAGEPAAS